MSDDPPDKVVVSRRPFFEERKECSRWISFYEKTGPVRQYYGRVSGVERCRPGGGTMLEGYAHCLQVRLDKFVVLPDHVHGILVITEPVGADLRVCPNDGESPCAPASGAHTGAPLPEIIQWFKTMTTNEYIHGVKTSGWPSFRGRLRQRNYYEHIIRNEDELNRVCKYIANNPAQWNLDRENPSAGAKNFSSLR
jgi:REP element-mobilizing transposase RayT